MTVRTGRKIVRKKPTVKETNRRIRIMERIRREHEADKKRFDREDEEHRMRMKVLDDMLKESE